MQGAKEPEFQRETAVLAHSVKGTMERESYLPVQLSTNEVGQLLAIQVKWGGSSDFVGFVHATALVIVPAGINFVEEGKVVSIVRLPV